MIATVAGSDDGDGAVAAVLLSPVVVGSPHATMPTMPNSTHAGSMLITPPDVRRASPRHTLTTTHGVLTSETSCAHSASVTGPTPATSSCSTTASTFP